VLEQVAASQDPVGEDQTGQGHPAVPPVDASRGKPSGGGLRGAVRGLAGLRVPPPRSVLATAASLAVLLVVFGVLVTGLDRLYGSLLGLPSVPGRAWFGVVGLSLGLCAVALRTDLAFDAPNQARKSPGDPHPVRTLSSLVLLVLCAVCAVLWSVGVR
jgi:hypothetical protein